MHRCIAEPELRGGYIKKSREADNKSKDCFSVLVCFFARGPCCFLFGPFGGCSFFWGGVLKKTLDD